jgi:hypothetical protein
MMNDIGDKYNITIMRFRRPNLVSILIKSETNINVDVLRVTHEVQ